MRFRSSKTDRSGRKYNQNQRSSVTPWLASMLFAATFALYIRQPPPTADDYIVSRIPPKELGDLEDDADNLEYVDFENEDEFKTLPMEYKSEPEIKARAEATFNATHHRLYDDLPPLPPMPLPQDELDMCSASWKFSKKVYSHAATHPAATVISWDEPRLVLFKSFLTPEEAAHLVAVAKENLERSAVLSDTGDDEANEGRTSYLMTVAR